MDVEQILSEIKVFASNVNNLLGMPMKFTTGHVEILSETISAIEQLQGSVNAGDEMMEKFIATIEQLRADNERLKDGISDMVIAMQGLKGGD